MFHKYYFLASFIFTLLLHSQVKIGDNPQNLQPSAILELESGNKGFLLPRVNLTSPNDVTTVNQPVAGLLVYNLSTQGGMQKGLYYWDSFWKYLSISSNTPGVVGWGVSGNTIGVNDFIGTLNYSPFIVKVNNTPFLKLQPQGGITFGIGSSAHDSHSIALGTNSLASNSSESTAIGYNSLSTAYRSMALGGSSQVTGVEGLALGHSVKSTGYRSIALGYGSESTAQNSLALGVFSKATENNTIILGDSNTSALRIGIGTNTPTDKLHVVGSLKVQDGTQSNGYVFTSDASGRGSWKNLNDQKVYGSLVLTSTALSLDQYTNIPFQSTIASKNCTVESDGLTVLKSGLYRVVYSIAASKNSGSSTVAKFNAYINYSTLLPASLTVLTLSNNESKSVSHTFYCNLTAYQKISIRPDISSSSIVYVPNGTMLSIELVE